jgi:hypothetical protein
MSNLPPKENGWNEWSKHVLAELERLNDKSDDLSKEMRDVQIKLATLKERASIWGAVSGAIVLAIGMVIQFFKG